MVNTELNLSQRSVKSWFMSISGFDARFRRFTKRWIVT